MSNQELEDFNHDGQIDQSDAELIVRVAQTQNQTKLAWAAMLGVIVVTLILLTPIVTDSRITTMMDLLQVYYIAQASIVGMYMGASTWLGFKAGEKVIGNNKED